MNALTCIDRLLDSLDKMIILDEVIPFLTEITCSDVDIIMAVIGRSECPRERLLIVKYCIQPYKSPICVLLCLKF